MRRSKPIAVWVSLVGLLIGMVRSAAAQKQLTATADYHKYIDVLVGETDFGIEYSEDGAADATVLYPLNESNEKPYGRPRNSVVALVRLGTKGIPVLIDCLGDGRITSVRFNGNDITKPMKVPVGYVCLDILMVTVKGAPVSERECPFDGLGACMNYGYYFRPDDYYECYKGPSQCKLRPWVSVVQQNWRRQFLTHVLRFHNPYNDSGIPDYKEFATPKK